MRLLPPLDGRRFAGLVVEVDDRGTRGAEGRGVDLSEAAEQVEMPEMVSEGVDLAFAGEDLERGESEIVDRLDRPAVLAIGVDETQARITT